MATDRSRRAGVGLRHVVHNGHGFCGLRIVNDPGQVSSYLRTFYQVRASGECIVIDGPCLSACTLLTGIVPRDHVCVTRRAVLGFHSASYYNDVPRSLVPTRAGTRLVMRLYPPEIRAWINQHGGLTPQLITMRGRDLAALYPPCPKLSLTNGANLFSLRLRS